MQKVDVIIIGAWAAGLMCAIEAGKRNRKVLVLDHANKPGKKILMSGGGRCNFTNYHVDFDKFLSHNTHFFKSALSRYTQWDFIALVEKHGIKYHEKTLGQLFCDNKSKDIVDMLLLECERAKVKIKLETTVTKIIRQDAGGFLLYTENDSFNCESLVIASGGLSIPTMGASPFGYKVAEQFGIKVWPTRAGLVPFTVSNDHKEKFSTLPGISAETIVSNQRTSFKENILFTHRGLSGPAILQISSYWQLGEEVIINFLPELDLGNRLKNLQRANLNLILKNLLSEYLPKRLVPVLVPDQYLQAPLQSFSHKLLDTISNMLHACKIKPIGTEGYRTAEVTLGGVDCDAICSKTMQTYNTPGLYFIGEVLDVTGWLGGYNFQWAWSSGWAAGQNV